MQAYQEDLLTLDELRARMPDLRAKQTSLQASIDALDAQLVDRETYLKFAENLESFLARLRDKAETATVEDRQKVLRSVVKEVLVGPEAHHPTQHPSPRTCRHSHRRRHRTGGRPSTTLPSALEG